MMTTEEMLGALCRSKGATLHRVIQLERRVSMLTATVIILSVLAMLRMMSR